MFIGEEYEFACIERNISSIKDLITGHSKLFLRIHCVFIGEEYEFACIERNISSIKDLITGYSKLFLRIHCVFIGEEYEFACIERNISSIKDLVIPSYSYESTVCLLERNMNLQKYLKVKMTR